MTGVTWLFDCKYGFLISVIVKGNGHSRGERVLQAMLSIYKMLQTALYFFIFSIFFFLFCNKMWMVHREWAMWGFICCQDILASCEELQIRLAIWKMLPIPGLDSQWPTPGTAEAQSQRETKLQMDWRILMRETRGCLGARLNNLRKCVVTKSNPQQSQFLCFTKLHCMHPEFWLDIWSCSLWADADWSSSAPAGGISYFFCPPKLESRTY